MEDKMLFAIWFLPKQSQSTSGPPLPFALITSIKCAWLGNYPTSDANQYGVWNKTASTFASECVLAAMSQWPAQQRDSLLSATSGALLTHDTLVTPGQSLPAWTAVGVQTRSTHIGPVEEYWQPASVSELRICYKTDNLSVSAWENAINVALKR